MVFISESSNTATTPEKRAMTVIPFAPRAERPEPGTRPRLPADAVVTGTFRSPSGRAGTFTGTYRLERFVSQFGELAAAGVFTGVLTDTDGSHIGMGSRRHTAAVEVTASRTTLLARLGPVDVNLVGFLVTVAEMTLEVDGASADIAAGLRVVDALRGFGRLPASVSELMSKVASAEAGTPRDGQRRGSDTEG
jgi:hypothetical protein